MSQTFFAKPPRPIARPGRSLARGLVRSFDCSERGGLKLYDSGPLGQHMTFATPPTRMCSAWGRATTLSVTAVGVDTGLPLGSSPCTIAFALNFTFTGAYRTVFSYGLAGTFSNARNIYTNTGNIVADNWGTAIPGTISIDDGRWHVVVVTMDGTTSIYIDNILDIASAQTLNTVSMNSPANQFLIGNDNGPDRAYTDGIDAIRVWDRVLSRKEIAVYSADPFSNYRAQSRIPLLTALIPVVTISLAPTTVSVERSATTTLTPTVGGTGNTAVTWSSSNIHVATVTSSGVVRGIDVGTATITATSVADNRKTATCVVTVNFTLLAQQGLITNNPSSFFQGLIENSEKTQEKKTHTDDLKWFQHQPPQPGD